MSIPFRNLCPAEEVKFRLWARDNYVVFTPIPDLWHPVVREECHKMNQEMQATLSDSQLAD